MSAKPLANTERQLREAQQCRAKAETALRDVTTAPSPSVDPVRERIAEIQQRIAIGKERAEEDTGDGDAIISAWSMFAAVAEHDAPALVAALTAVLDRHQSESIYEICNHTDSSEGGIAEHAWETSDGDWVCGPKIGERCQSCRDTDGSDIDWPCAEYLDLAAGLGVTP